MHANHPLLKCHSLLQLWSRHHGNPNPPPPCLVLPVQVHVSHNASVSRDEHYFLFWDDLLCHVTSKRGRERCAVVLITEGDVGNVLSDWLRASEGGRGQWRSCNQPPGGSTGVYCVQSKQLQCHRSCDANACLCVCVSVCSSTV